MRYNGIQYQIVRRQLMQFDQGQFDEIVGRTLGHKRSRFTNARSRSTQIDDVISAVERRDLDTVLTEQIQFTADKYAVMLISAG